MNLNLFEDRKKDVEHNHKIKNFIEELTNFLKDVTKNLNQNKDNNGEKGIDDKEHSLDEGVNKHRKEGHLYLVTEDRNDEIYLWDFTEKSKVEFKEIIDSEELLSVAKEGAMLQYRNGKYELYSKHGFYMVQNKD